MTATSFFYLNGGWSMLLMDMISRLISTRRRGTDLKKVPRTFIDARARHVWPNYVQFGADTGTEWGSDLRKRSRTNKTARRPWPLIVELIQSTRIMTASRRIKCAVWSHRLIDGVISQWDPSGVTKGALPLNNRTGSLDERLKSSVPPDIPRLMSARCAKNQEYCLFPIPLEKP